MIDIFKTVREKIEDEKKLPSKTIITLSPSSQVCYDREGKQLGSCMRQVWLQKMDYPSSNPLSLEARVSGYFGNKYEDWLINILKSTPLYYASQAPLTDPSRLVKGIVDLILKNPETGELELGEIKSYDGSNYNNSSTLLGNTKVNPKPRLKNLLQLFRYNLISKDFKIDKGNLLYIDRSCTNYSRNKQFKIELVEINDDTFPKVSCTTSKGEYYEYVETSVSASAIYKSEDILLTHLGSNTIPPKDFIETYSKEEIEIRRDLKLIPDYLYARWEKDPSNNPLGDFQCRYCAFSKGTCRKIEEDIL